MDSLNMDYNFSLQEIALLQGTQISSVTHCIPWRCPVSYFDIDAGKAYNHKFLFVGNFLIT